MADCRNPECQRGLTPGVVIVGKGNAKNMVLGAQSRWAWVRCLACKPDPEDGKRGAVYKHVHRTPEEIAQRASLATSKAPYQPAVTKKLEGIANRAVNHGQYTPPPTQSDQSGQITKLLEQVSQLNQTIMKLTNQVTDLLEENRALRKQMEVSRSAPSQQVTQ